MKEIDLKNYSNAVIGKDVKIQCDEFHCEGQFYIEDNVTISAKKIYLGKNAKIERNTSIGALKDNLQSFSLGDESLIGFNSQVLVPSFSMGDYSRIFNSALISGYMPVSIGHNCWIGQSAVLNSADTLTIGNNVRMGGNIQIWTHVASGELLEGCLFNSQKPVIIKDNVWLMGFGHTISPGVTLAKNTIVMSGSVITKDTEEFHTYSGIPAKDITSNLNGWKRISLDEKFDMLKRFVKEFSEEYPEYRSVVFCLDINDKEDNNTFKGLLDKINVLIFLKNASGLEEFDTASPSIFDLETKHYLKRRTPVEASWMRFSIGYRARFLPWKA